MHVLASYLDNGSGVLPTCLQVSSQITPKYFSNTKEFFAFHCCKMHGVVFYHSFHYLNKGYVDYIGYFYIFLCSLLANTLQAS